MFTPAELVAMSNAIKDKQLSEAKQTLADNSATPVDFKVHFKGTVMKGTSTEDTLATRAPQVCLTDFTVVCAVFRQLGIGVKRLRTALIAVGHPSNLQVDANLSNVFDEVAAELAKSLPMESIRVAGKRGSVTAQVTPVKV